MISGREECLSFYGEGVVGDGNGVMDAVGVFDGVTGVIEGVRVDVLLGV